MTKKSKNKNYDDVNAFPGFKYKQLVYTHTALVVVLYTTGSKFNK